MTKKEDLHLPVAWYGTAFLDLLGQRELLREMKEVPGRPDEVLRDKLRRIALPVLSLRSLFRSFFKGFGEVEDPEVRRNINAQSQGEPNEDLALTLDTFSDSMTASVPLIAESDHFTPMRGLSAILLASAAVWVVGLSRGWPVRGGIDVGPSMRLPTDGEVFGASLERAVSLEEELAQWPRVAVGRELESYLDFVGTMEGAGSRAEAAARLARLCKTMIIRDAAGVSFLDALGPTVRGFFRDVLPLEEVKGCLRSMTQMSETFGGRNPKLANRYASLSEYAEPRVQEWLRDRGDLPVVQGTPREGGWNWPTGCGSGCAGLSATEPICRNS